MYPSMITQTRFKKLIPVLLVATGLIANCKKAPADLQGAVITALRGVVHVTDNRANRKEVGASALNTRDAIVMPGYLIETETDAQVDLQFTTELRLRLGPSSSFRIETAPILADSNFSQLQLNLAKGRIYTQSPKLSSLSRITVVTPTAIASVRGTEFVTKQENGKNQTLVKEGAVEVADHALQNIATVAPDQKADVNKDGKVQVSPQTDDDKKEVQDLGKDIASLNESARDQIQAMVQQLDEQKILLKQTMEEQKQSNEELMRQKKDQDKDLIQKQKQGDLENLREQIKRDRENMDQMRNQLQQDGQQMRQNSRDDQNKIQDQGRQDMNQIKQNSPSHSQDQLKGDLDKLKNK